MSAYSMPLCTIFTKCPAPSGPTCVTHTPASLFAAIASSTGRTCAYASAGPPGMMDGPYRAPSSPPDTPTPMKCSPFCFHASSRLRVSWNQELPQSSNTSPGCSSGSSLSIIESTAAPAVTISMMRRGRSSAATKSSSLAWPFRLSGAPFSRRSSKRSGCRSHTATR